MCSIIDVDLASVIHSDLASVFCSRMIGAGRFLQQRYRIDKQIGQGGMGAVYVATDERFGSTVAIKETLCMDDNFRKAIEREARLLNSLKHNALPRVSDHFEEENSQFLVMEYITGEDLCSIMDEGRKTFDVEEILLWADQLLDALDYLHNQDIPVIHRDIKPQNLKLTPRGQIVLLDFGLAKGNPTDAAHQTAAKSIFGYSRSYASLEQIQGTGTDPRSDLYSLAATLYHLLTRVAPEDALTRAMAVLSHKPDPLVPANLVRPDVPAGVAGILQKAMDLNASGRPSTATEMRQMLREHPKYAYLANEAVTARQIDIPPPIQQPTRLMPDGTNAAVRQTDIKTEVLPTYQSELTSIRPGTSAAALASTSGNSFAPKRRRGLVMAAAAAGLLLVAGLFAGGLYVAKPSLFGDPEPQPIEPAKDIPGQTSGAHTEQTATDQPPADQGAGGTTAEPAPPPAGDRTADPKQPETTKTTKTGQRQAGTDATDPDIQIFDPGGDEDVTITERGNDGRVRTTRIRPAQPDAPGMDRIPNGSEQFPRFDPNKYPQMSPQQRRKLQQQLQRVLRNVPGQPSAQPE